MVHLRPAVAGLRRDSPESFRGWRRGELNPCPRRCRRRHLHVYPALRFKEPTLHRRTAVSRASAKFLHLPARSLRRKISLLSTFGAVAGVQLQTSRSIKPRERDLGDLRLFVLARFLTRPTNHPRHAACASNHKSKPVRPHFERPKYIARSPCTQQLQLEGAAPSAPIHNGTQPASAKATAWLAAHVPPFL
jgi:hypothetical protein